jgi:CHAT domain-containing protein
MKDKNSSAHSITLFGGLNYNSSLDDMELQAMVAKEQNRSKGSNSSERNLWTYLPGTMKEVKTIAPIMQTAGYEVKMLTQDEGVEESFKALSETSTGIIHIATHGYFLPSADNSLQTSGLIFSGANNFWGSNTKIQSATDDGVLTAEEIANLNLMGTILVVLSACQSGLGTISGEGVFGWQRAFKKAGVQSILMSLWEVDDEATQILMTTFYQHLTRGASKYEALKMAQDTVRGHTFIRNGEKHSGSDPHYWASFVIID